MTAGKDNWVCFRCRFSTRQAKMSSRTPKCRVCGEDCCCVGSKVEIPRKRNINAWKQFRISFYKIAAERKEEDTAIKAQYKRRLEKNIIRLEAMDENRDRRRYINSLKEYIGQMDPSS